MEFKKRENITLIVVLIITALAFGSWGIYKLTNPPEEEQSDYYYALGFFPYGYPDVIMELEFERDHTVEEKEKIVDDFCYLYNEYNEKTENPIHYLAAYDNEETDKKLTFYIDFGNADEAALYMFLEYLDLYTTEIKKVSVG